MKKILFFLIFIVTLNFQLSTLNLLHAETFKILGTRPLGMGGAFVAVAEDTLAQYWNPAGLAKQKLFDLQAPITAGAKLTGGILKEADAIKNISTQITAVQNAQTNGEKIDQKQILNFYKALKSINNLNKPGLGALIELPASVAIRISRTSWQLNNFTEIGLKPSIDLQNIGLGAMSAGSGAILKNSSGAGSFGSIGAVTFSTSNLSGVSLTTLDQRISTTTMQDLAAVIAGMKTTFNIGLTDLTTTQVATALINLALQQNVTPEEVTNTTQEIKTTYQELKDAGVLTGTFSGFKQNNTMLTLRGVSILEISAAYGQPLFHKDVLAGINFKVMRGYIGFSQLKIMQGESTDLNGMLTDYTKNVKESYNMGVDLGLMLDKLQSWRTRIGILARNVNSPSFKQPDAAVAAGEGSNYKVDPQVRAGVALYPLRGFFGWLLAADIDLTKNSTLVPGYKSQLFSVGTEVNLGGRTWFNVAARAGLMKNLAEKGETAYTVGLGMNFLHLQFDLAGAISKDKTEIEVGKEFPSSAQVSGTLTLNF